MAKTPDWIPLADAPAKLLNPEVWERLVDLQGNERTALSCLKKSPPFFEFECNIGLPGTSECLKTIKSALMDAVRSGRIVMRGIPSGRVTKEVIDPSQADRMKFDFPKNEIRMGNVICRDVSVARVVPAGGIVPEIVRWLEQNQDLPGGKEHYGIRL